MTDEASTGSEQWVKRETLVADWDMWQIVAMDGEVAKFFVADMIPDEATADLIIADHDRATADAARIRALEAALTAIAGHPGRRSTTGAIGIDWARNVAREALRQLSVPESASQ